MNALKNHRFLAAATFAFALAAGPALAGQTGELQGYIIDAEGIPLAGVTVSLNSPQLIGGERTELSGEEGDFRFASLEPGTYSVSLDHPGYLSVTERGITVAIDAVVIRDYLLEPRPIDEPVDGEAPREILVTATAPVIDTTSTSTSTSITPEMTDRIPTSRDYQGMADLIPGAVDSGGASGNPNIHGGTGYGNQYLLDGINITDPVTNTFSANFNFDAIAETQILTGGMDAEYGYASGGIVNIVTKSGGDKFTLDGSVYWSPSQLQLLDPGEENDSNAIEANLAVGGPVVKKRLWFFLSGQYVDSSTVIPQDEPFFDTVETLPPTTFRALYLLGKLKWQPLDWQRVTLVMQGDPTWITNERLRDTIGVHPKAERQRFQGGARVGVTSETTLSDNLLWKTQAGYFANRLQIFPLSNDFDTASHFNQSTGAYTENDYLDFDNYRFRLQLHSSLTWFLEDFLGDHEIKGGVDGQITWQTLYESRTGASSCDVVAGDECVGVVFRDNGLERDGSSLAGVGDPSEVQVVRSELNKLIWGNTASVFLQDAWRPFRSLTIRPGLRFDSARAFNDPEDGGKEIYNLNWLSPRFGVAWDPFGDGKTVLRAGYYQYADMGMLLLSEFVGRSLEIDTYAYNDRTGRYDEFVSRQGGQDAVVSKDNLVTPVTHEIVAGIEREIFDNTAAGAHLIYRRKTNMWEDDETNVQWNEDGDDAIGFNNGNPEFIFSLGTPDAAFMQYLGLELKLDKRLADNWALLASYTLSRTEGTLTDLVTYSLDNPRQRPFEFGFHEDDHTHKVRVATSYELPMGITVGLVANYLSGRPYDHLYLNNYYGGYLDRRAPRGCDPDQDWTSSADCAQLRLPPVFRVDARVTWRLEELTGQDIWLIADVRNIFNNRPTTAVETRDVNDGADFGAPLQRARPMRAQLALRYRF
jgi:hypothetical protein